MTEYKTVYENQTDILTAILALHCPAGFECDVTFGNGAFYKDLKKPRLCFDLDPQCPGVRKSCSTALPIKSGTLQNVVFDPPFLTYIRSGRNHNSIMAKRFSGYWTYKELEDHYRGTIHEVERVLIPQGIFIIKCQDIIHNHKLMPTHINVVSWCNERGLVLEDLFVLTAKHRMPVNTKGTQQHARIYHSYFLVFKKKSLKR